VGSAEEGIRKVAEDDFDAVILDLALPGMSGLELLKLLRKSRPKLPVIIISGSTRLVDEEIVGRLGAYACLEKPFGCELLIDLIKRAVTS
jgi:DNA-binding response OmpR family regulator